jgi:hypothetical protein
MRRKRRNQMILNEVFYYIALAHVLNNGQSWLAQMPVGDFHDGFPQQRR